MSFTREKFERFIRTCPYFIQKMVISAIEKREYDAWVRSEKPLPPARIVKEKLIERYKDKTGYKTMVETGTYRGDMVFTHLKKFDKIYSIELDDWLYNTAVKRFKSFPHVKILHGDSGKVLTHLMNELQEPAIFWLDGHYSGGFTAMGETVTPIYEELKTIFSKKFDHVILIDDARLFNGADGYPTFDDLKKFIHHHYPQQRIEVGDDCIQFVLKH